MKCSIMTKPLSPAAQAVKDAAYTLAIGTGLRTRVAAALREVVSQLKYDKSCWDEPVEHMVLDARAILAIAAELDNS